MIVAAAVLLRAGLSKRATVDTMIMGAGSAFALMNVDLIFATRGVISRIYLYDAAIELLFLGMWTWCAPALFDKRKE